MTFAAVAGKYWKWFEDSARSTAKMTAPAVVMYLATRQHPVVSSLPSGLEVHHSDVALPEYFDNECS